MIHPLVSQTILEAIHIQPYSFPVKLTIHQSIDSTNTFLKNNAVPQEIHLCCAEEQTKGRGRFSRTWQSPLGGNIYLSISYPIPVHRSLSGLSLVIGLAVIEAIRTIEPCLSIKWPNDVLWMHKKLAGILIETKIIDTQWIIPVIGIGLNVNSTAEQLNVSDKTACSLYDIKGHTFDRNALIAALFLSVHTNIQLFIDKGLNAFQIQWKNYDYLYNHFITLTQGEQTFQGYAKGINQEGLLILENLTDGLHFFSSGDSSITLRTPKNNTF